MQSTVLKDRGASVARLILEFLRDWLVWRVSDVSWLAKLALYAQMFWDIDVPNNESGRNQRRRIPLGKCMFVPFIFEIPSLSALFNLPIEGNILRSEQLVCAMIFSDYVLKLIYFI